MKFKNPTLEAEYKALHPKTLEILNDLEVYCKANTLEEPMATHIHRTVPQQVEIYWRNIMRDQKVDEPTARKLAAAQWTWHLVDCACDLRSYIYSPPQLDLLVKYLMSKWKSQDVKNEILCHNVGSGTHLHVGFRDYQRYKLFHRVP